jgi:hypothetical protein
VTLRRRLELWWGGLNDRERLWLYAWAAVIFLLLAR